MLRAILALALVPAVALGKGNPQQKPDAKDAKAEKTEPAEKPAVDDPLANYFTALQTMKLIDVESGTLESLKHDLAIQLV